MEAKKKTLMVKTAAGERTRSAYTEKRRKRNKYTVKEEGALL
jgi:hypothetical protein